MEARKVTINQHELVVPESKHFEVVGNSVYFKSTSGTMISPGFNSRKSDNPIIAKVAFAEWMIKAQKTLNDLENTDEKHQRQINHQFDYDDFMSYANAWLRWANILEDEVEK